MCYTEWMKKDKSVDKLADKLAEIQLVNETGIVKGITPQHLMFARYYTTRGDYFGKAYAAYAQAYDYEIEHRPDGSVDIMGGNYLTCKANGSRVLNTEKVQQQIQLELLEKFNEKTADARTSEIIIAGKDADSIQAIKIFNDLKQRITKKIDVSVAARPFQDMSDEELRNLAGE